MSDKTVAQKARVKPGTTVSVLNSVPGVVESLGLPEDVRLVEPGSAQIVLLFVNSREELEEQMPPAASSLAPGAALWVLFRKGSRTAGHDMSRNDVWAIAERMEMSPLGLVSVDDTWTAFRLKRS